MESIQFWTKEHGADGYFDFCEQTLGQIVAYDDRMEYGVPIASERCLGTKAAASRGLP